MGRPRVHDSAARVALLDAAQKLAAGGGFDAVGVRAAAAAAGTTTRAVYSVFGSKEDLVEGLAERAFELLSRQVAAVPLTGDAVHDLIEGSVLGFRRFAIEHHELFRLFFIGSSPAAWRQGDGTGGAAEEAYEQFITRVQAAHGAGLGAQHSVRKLTLIWDSMCSGLALREICGGMNPERAEQTWRDALGALALGLSQIDRPPRRKRRVVDWIGARIDEE